MDKGVEIIKATIKHLGLPLFAPIDMTYVLDIDSYSDQIHDDTADRLINITEQILARKLTVQENERLNFIFYNKDMIDNNVSFQSHASVPNAKSYIISDDISWEDYGDNVIGKLVVNPITIKDYSKKTGFGQRTLGKTEDSIDDVLVNVDWDTTNMLLNIG